MAEAKKATTKKKAEKPVEEAPIDADAVVEIASVDEPQVKEPEVEKTAKAGKRSAKAVAEAEELQAKEDRKATGKTAEAKPKPAVKPTRSRLERRAKGFKKSAELIEVGKLYSVDEA